MNTLTHTPEVLLFNSASDSSESHESYSQQDILSLMVGSFRFSRGSPASQVGIFKYLGHNHGDRLHPGVIASCEEPLTQIAINYLDRGIHQNIDSEKYDLDTEAITQETKKQLRILAGMTDFLETHQYILGDVTKALIIADENWLPQIREKRGQNTCTGPYRSNLVIHGLLGRSAGRPEFDQMFQDVTNDILGPYNFRKDEVGEIFREHLKDNPDDTEAVELRLRSALTPHLSS